jgi:transcriptional regulator with XRE-family HTH domain
VESKEEIPLKIWVGEQLRGLREGRGLSVEQVAEKAKLSPAGVRKMEGPNSNITVDNLAALVKAFDLTLSEFFEPRIPPDNIRYDRYVHKVIKAALRHTAAKWHVQSFVGMITAVMKTQHPRAAETQEQGNILRYVKKKGTEPKG